MRRRTGIAVVTVLLISAVILAFVLGGLNLASQHLFQVSSLHSRHRALYAAEIGVCKARYALENNANYAGTLSENLPDGTRYNTQVSRSGIRAVIVSRGNSGSQQQTLRVTLSLDADSYEAVASKSEIKIFAKCFINGIRSLEDPRSARGNGYSRQQIHFEDNSDRLSYTGQVHSRNGANRPGSMDPRQVNPTDVLSTTDVNKANLISGVSGSPNFVGDTLSRSGVISGDYQRSTPLHIPAGQTLYVRGDCVLHGGVTGEGTLVVDGALLMRANSNLRKDTPKGLMVYAERDVVLAHPRAKVDKDDEGSASGWITENDALGELFAGMPADVPYLLSQRLPVGAPTDSGFFEWYGQMAAQNPPAAAFDEWLNGDGTSLNPGLSQEVKDWLDQASRMSREIERRAP